MKLDLLLVPLGARYPDMRAAALAAGTDSATLQAVTATLARLRARLEQSLGDES